MNMLIHLVAIPIPPAPPHAEWLRVLRLPVPNVRAKSGEVRVIMPELSHLLRVIEINHYTT